MTRAVTIFFVVAALAIAGFAMSDLPSRFGIITGQGSVSAEDDHGHVHEGPVDDAHAHDAHAHNGHSHADGNPFTNRRPLSFDAHDETSHDIHSHDPQSEDGHTEDNAIALSKQARANLGLRLQPVSIGNFVKYVEVPGLVTNWPGRTHIVVTSPLTGVINAIHVARGEMIKDGTPLFSLRLTHQDLVKTQEQFLTQLGQLDVEDREINRLTAIASSGAVAGKTLINRQYERDKLLAGVRAARQSMLLHGLAEQQIENIELTRQLVREITVYAPEFHEDDSLHHDALEQNRSVAQEGDADHVHVDAELLVTMLEVDRGQSVEAGETLAQLSDYSQVLIEGHAFQRDGDVLRDAAQSQAPIQAVLESASDRPEIVDGLRIVYIGNEIGRQTRALPFYVELKNEVERSEIRGRQRYVSWRFKPGQRLKLRLPVSSLPGVIVVPKEAVAEEGLERFVFVESGDHFDRVSVRVLANDSHYVALANDNQLKLGQSVAIAGAHQLQMAMRNKSGAAIDPHHGHSH